jgi:photosystem II stability/assembly factor-like uncharacterized protein
MNRSSCSRRTVLLAGLGAGLGPALAAGEAAAPGLRALRQPALPVARPTRAVLQGVAAAGRRLVAYGERGLVICSDDAGQTWTQAQVPVRCTLTAARFTDARQGWAVGNLGVVLETADGGSTWAQQLDGQQAAGLALKAAREARTGGQTPPAVTDADRLTEDAERLVAEGPDKPLLDLGSAPDGSLLAVGAYGLAVARQGGAWRSYMPQLPNPDGFTFYGCAERGGERWLYGEQGLLLCSPAPGQPYQPQPALSGGSLFGSLVLRDGTLLLLGLRGKVWRSAAVGAPWQAVQTPVDATLLSGVQRADGSVLLVGAAGQVLLSRDGANSFRPLALPQRFPFTGAAQAHDGSVLLVGMRGLLRLTPDQLQAAAPQSS